MDLRMSRPEREAFLAETHVATISIAQEGRGPLVVPVWYDYEPGGDVRVVTGGDSRKVGLLRRAGRLTLCAQTESMPYKYVTVEGPVSFDRPDFERDVRAVALRYLGEKMGEAYLAMTEEQHRTAILLRLRPERWSSADFRKVA
jgi:hypothetical protein